MERTDGEAWERRRQQHGPVQRILPTGELAGPEEVAMLEGSGRAAAPSGVCSVRDVALARDVPALEVPLASLERSDGTAWQPVGEATAARRQALAPMRAATLPYLRRVSDARRSGAMPLVGFGHGEGFLQPGAQTSMANDAPVTAYDGSGVGRSFNLLYIDEESDHAVVGMGSATGALYSANVSLRLLPLADVYLPFSKVASPSLPVGKLLHGGIGEVIEELYGAGGAGGPGGEPHFKYDGAPLPPADDSVFASLRSLFGVGR
eukprot:2647704-Prymnesium_polylepis.1